MSDEIKPALSKEEWDGGWLKRSALEAEWDLDDEGFALLGPGYALQVDAPADLHALAALALHGQDFGFTREERDVLRAVVAVTAGDRLGHLSPEERAARVDYEFETLATIARKVAALLPPETP